MSTTCLSTTASTRTPGAFCRARRSEELSTHRRTNNNNNYNRTPPERPGTGLGQAVRKSHGLKIAAPVLKICFHLLHVHPSLFCSSWGDILKLETWGCSREKTALPVKERAPGEILLVSSRDISSTDEVKTEIYKVSPPQNSRTTLVFAFPGSL